MRSHTHPVSTTLALTAAGLGTLALTGGTAQATPFEAEPVTTFGAPVPEPISVETLTGFAGFTDEVSVRYKRKLDGQGTEVIAMADPDKVVIARITVQPGAAFPWHTHPGAVVVSVVSGELIYQQANDCVERSYAADDAFLDPGNRVHTAWNPSPEEATELIGVFHGASVGEPVTLPEEDQSDRCR